MTDDDTSPRNLTHGPFNPGNGTTRSSVKTIQSANRALMIFECVSQRGPISAADLSRESGLAFATVQRVLRTLTEAGWIRRRLTENTYEVSFTFLKQLVHQHHARCLVEHAAPHMAQAAQELECAIFLGELQPKGIVEIKETTLKPPSESVERRLYGLQRSMVFMPLGTVQLAFMSDAEREERLDDLRQNGRREEQDWIASPEFARQLEQIRDTGIATRHPALDPEVLQDGSVVHAYAVPILQGDRVFGALSLVGTNTNLTVEAAMANTGPLRRYADLIAGEVARAIAM